MPRKPKPLADQLRAAIAAAEKQGVTRYQISKDSGVAASALSRLVSGERSVSIESAEAIAQAIGYQVRLDRDE